MKPWLTATTGGPKGPSRWNPKRRLARIARDVIAVVEELHAADALPVGPRTIGYRLSMRANPSGTRYAKTLDRVSEGYGSFDDVTEAVKRLRQAGVIPWEWISDGSAVSHPAPGFDSPEAFASHRLDPDAYERDMRHDQPVVVEVYSESAELTPLLARTALPYGARVYSGRGSAGPDLAREAAIRAWNRYAEKDGDGQSLRTRTLILGVGDLDHAGVQNVMRPHVEHVGAFLRGFAAEQGVSDGLAATILDFHRLAITPEQGVGVAERMSDPEGADRLRLYAASGEDDWTRDVRLLGGAPKVETEALDPVALRDLLIAEIEGTLDMSVVERIRDEQKDERDTITDMRTTLGLEA